MCEHNPLELSTQSGFTHCSFADQKKVETSTILLTHSNLASIYIYICFLLPTLTLAILFPFGIAKDNLWSPVRFWFCWDESSTGINRWWIPWQQHEISPHKMVASSSTFKASTILTSRHWDSHGIWVLNLPSISHGSPFHVFFATVLFSKPPSVRRHQRVPHPTAMSLIGDHRWPIFLNDTNTYMSDETPIWPYKKHNPKSISIHWWLNHVKSRFLQFDSTLLRQAKIWGTLMMWFRITRFYLLKCSWSNLWNLFVFLHTPVLYCWLYKFPCVFKTPNKISIICSLVTVLICYKVGPPYACLLFYNHIYPPR